MEASGIELRQRSARAGQTCNGKAEKTEIVRVKRRLGLTSGVALIVGTIIGSGIFISPKGVLSNSGSVGMSLIVWAICGILSMCAALVYSELGTLIPKNGGDYAYLLETFGSLPAFLLVWISNIIIGPAGTVVQALKFAEYLIDAVSDGCGPPEYTKKILAVAAMLTITITNLISVRLVARLQIIFTFIKTAGLIVIIIGGFLHISQGTYGSLTTGFEGTTSDVGSIAIAVYSGLWAYDGWAQLNFVVEELQNPRRNLVLCIIISVILVMVIYLLVNVSYLALMSKEEFLSSYAVAFTWGSKVLGPATSLIPIVVACSVYGSAHGSGYVSGRVLFAAGREGHMPESFSYIHIKNQIPMFAVIVKILISCLMMIPADVGALLNFIGFLSWFFYGVGMINVIKLRFRLKDAPRVFKVPLIIPVLVLLCCIYLVVSPFVRNPRIEFLFALGGILAGVLVYIPFVYFKLALPGMDYLTCFVQLLLQIEPTTEEENILERLRMEGNENYNKK